MTRLGEIRYELMVLLEHLSSRSSTSELSTARNADHNFTAMM